jgi:hypothetical protein
MRLVREFRIPLTSEMLRPNLGRASRVKVVAIIG